MLPVLARRVGMVCAGFALLVAPVSSLCAQDVSGFRHTHWSLREGAPIGISAIAQTDDGFLWLGASSGLYRFDGIGFDHVAPPRSGRPRANMVTALAAGGHGDLWVGFDYGGIALYHKGALRPTDRLTAHGRIVSIVASPRGEVWALGQSAFGSALLHFDGRRWHVTGVPQGLPDEMLQTLYLDRQGALWLATYPHLYRMAPGSHHLERQGFDIGMVPSFVEDAAGHLWVHSQAGLRQVAGQSAAPPPFAGTYAGRGFGQAGLLFDHKGAFWIAGGDGGLRTVDALRPVAAQAALYPSVVETLFLDREGTVWGGSREGLDRYVPSVIEPFAVPGTIRSGLVQGAAGTDGFHLVTDQGGYRVAQGRLTPLVAARDIEVACAGGDAVAFVGQKTKLLLQGGRRRTLPFLSSQYPVQGCAIDGHGTFWETTPPLGVFHWDGRHLVREPGVTGGQQLVPLRPDGMIALRPLGDVVLIGRGAPQVIWKAADISIGFIKLVRQIGPMLYFGGDGGLARYDGRRIAVLPAALYPWLQNVTGLVRHGAESWLIGDQGIMRVPTAALEQAFDHPGMVLDAQAVGAGEGIVARLPAYIASDAVADASGRLWFDTNRGLVRIDPSRRLTPGLPPPVSITRVLVDGKAQAPDALNIPKGVSRIEIDYTALSLTDTRSNRYRYRLDGVDKGWVEAGHDRSAAYVNLAPGTYHFQVIAAGVDGVWNKVGASLELTVPPFFWQTWWFRLALALGAVGLLARGALWYSRAEVRRARLGFEARMAERERIARELHDTLLQGFHGLMLRFQAVALKVPPGSQVHDMIQSAMERGDDVLLSARERVHDLRAPAGGDDLPARLEQLAERYRESGFVVSLSFSGSPPLLEPECIAETLAIVEEALANIERHAGAGRITIETSFSARRMSVTVSDDGIGIPPDILAAMRREGHYGLVGMQERAAKLTGSLRIRRVQPHGTAVSLVVPVLMREIRTE
ncbi:MAG: hypothetical protein KGJ57_16655 [Sphingomonadales bacterium]|nr:hypothetical protein [Sphingomonadales bacterium]MDE2171030.1 hypothetical protein [Sphingomonadales bacterium]